MKVLFLIYARFNSFQEFVVKGQSGLSWVDSMADEIVKHKKITLAMAIPVKSGTFEKKVSKGLHFYGLPNYSKMNKIHSYLLRVKHKLNETDLIYWTLEAINDFNPDIIQIFGTENPFTKVISHTEKKVIIHFQGSLQVVLKKWFAALTIYEQIVYSSFWNLILHRGIFHEYFTFKNKVIEEKTIMKQCRYMIGRTGFDKNLISFFAPEAKYFHCDEFLRINFLKNNWDVPLGKSVTCISVLKGVTYKGLDLLFELFSVLKNFMSIDVSFKICGIREDEDIVKMLKRKYRKQVDFSKFFFLGRLDADSLIHNMITSNFFIHPSYIENSSNSICEAMALGMPVIATNVGGTNSLIQNGIDGLLIQEGEPFSLAAALIYLINDYDFAKRLGKNAKTRSLIRQNPSTLFNELVQIYDTVISEK